MSRRDDDEMDALDELLRALDFVDAADEMPRPVRLYTLGLIAPGVPKRSRTLATREQLVHPRDRVSSRLLCGYDVTDQGARARLPVGERAPPCRRTATHVVRYWLNDFSHLFVCPLHLRAMIKRHPNDRIKPERLVKAPVSVHEADPKLRR